MKYAFPAVFHAEDVGGYSIYFPDVPRCFSEGENIPECRTMAGDALSLMLSVMEGGKAAIPAPTPAARVRAENPGDIVEMVYAETMACRRICAPAEKQPAPRAGFIPPPPGAAPVFQAP